MLYAILVIVIIVLLIIVLSQRKRTNEVSNSRGTSLESVLKEAYPNRTYKEIFDLGFLNAKDLLEKMPTYRGNDIEILAFLSRIGNITVDWVGGDIKEYERQVLEYFDSKKSVEEKGDFIIRSLFYRWIAEGDKVIGRWAFGDVPTSFLENVILRCAVAFGDCITNPKMIEDYENAPIAVYGITDMTDFQKRFVGDFFRFIHTYCVMLAGKEFDPPIITDYEGKGE